MSYGLHPTSYLLPRRSVSPPEVRLELNNVSSTGHTGPRLVVLPGILRPGGTYVFHLRATYAGNTASATSHVLMNRAPYGGALQLSHVSPLVALTTTITLQASQ